MKESFKPDYGLWVKENLSTADIFFFYNLEIKDILRISLMDYFLFTVYRFDGVEYALSLDFPISKLEDLIKILAPHFDSNNFKTLVDQLTDPEYKYKTIQWNEPIGGINCKSCLGKLEVNHNERYIPFKIIGIV